MSDGLDRPVTIPIREILSIVSCAETYGFGDSILMDALAEWAGTLSDAEIEAYAASFLTPKMREEGYGEEDAVAARRKLRYWRRNYVLKEAP